MSSTTTSTHSKYINFLLGGTATSAAAIFSNPMEVVKTRFQILYDIQQREGIKGAEYNFKEAMKMARKEGIRGIQAGLLTAILYQFVMNGTRLGSYSLFKVKADEYFPNSSDTTIFFRNLLCASIAGGVGAAVGSPLYLVKTRLQTQALSTANTGKVRYTGTIQAYKSILAEEGIRGCYRGTSAAVMRVSFGSAVQLTTYDLIKSFAVKSIGMDPAALSTQFFSSLLCSFFVLGIMNPLDMTTSRLYNQPIDKHGQPKHYRNVFDCLSKTLKAEGIRGWYKGSIAHYLRLGPHSILTFVIWEQLRVAFDPAF